MSNLKTIKSEKNIRPIKKEGVYTELKLVELLCTEAVIRSYKKKNWFASGRDKDSFLLKLDMYCKHEFQKADRTYNVIEVFEEPKSKEFLSLKQGLYQYTVPLLMKKILEEKDKNNKVNIIMNVFEWAKQIEMVNQNYNLVRYNSQTISEFLEIPNDFTIDFIHAVNNSINYYIRETLIKMQKVKLIDLHIVRIICVSEIDKNIEVDGNNIKIKYKDEKREADDEENNLINTLMEQAMEYAGITNKDSDIIDTKQSSQCYYGHKAEKYQKKLKELLKIYNIKYFYSAYKIFVKSTNRAKNFLNKLEINSYSELIGKFNQEFTDILLNNLDNRYITKIKKKYDDKKIKPEELEDMICKLIEMNASLYSSYSDLSDITIKKIGVNLYNQLKEDGLYGEGCTIDTVPKEDDLSYDVVFVKKK